MAETVASFETSLDELEKVVRELETGDLPLDRSLELFSRGGVDGASLDRVAERAEG